MPSTLTYPGVYIEEIPSGVRTITGVATSITAFIGRTPRGPVNEPTIVNSFGEFERLFGGLAADHTVAYAVNDFFRNGGGQAIIVRLYKPFFANDTARTAAFNAAIAQAQTAADAVKGDAATAAGLAGATPASVATAANAQVATAGAAGPAALFAAQQVAAAAQAESTKAPYVTSAQNMDISGSPTGGTIKLTFEGDETAAAIPLSDLTGATWEAKLKTALEALPSIGVGNIASVTRSGGSPNFSFLITFGGTLNGPQNLIVLSDNSLTGGTSPTVTISTTAQRLDISGSPTGGTVKLTFNGDETVPAIPLSDLTGATGEAKLKTALEGLPSIGVGNIARVTRSGLTPNFSFLIDFAGTLTGPQNLIELSDNSLTGGTSPTITISLPLPDAASVAAAAATAAGTAGTPGSAVTAAAGTVAPMNRAQLKFANGLTIEAATPGVWGNFLRAAADYNTKPKDDGSADPDLYNLTIEDGVSGKIEQVRNVSIAPNAVREAGRVLANESSLVRVVGTPPASRPAAGQISADPASLAVDSQPLVAADFTGSSANKTGLFALDKADLFNLLCIPADTRDGDTPVAVYQDAMAYCTSHRAMLIVDPPVAWGANPDTAAAAAVAGLPALGLNGPAARNAALFFPRVIEFDPQRGGQLDTFVPCGAVAGIFARTDSTRGVWKAPAGMDAAVNGIAGLQVKLSDGENGQLNPRGINSLRIFPLTGSVVWGARTLRGADAIGDEYKYIPVRRLALFLEETLYRNTQWVVFEPNDEPLWAQIRLNIGAFMHTLFRQGAFQGTTPKDAYFVKCDKETTTQNDINLGIVNIVVGFAPLKPAEFVVIKIQQIAGQIET